MSDDTDINDEDPELDYNGALDGVASEEICLAEKKLKAAGFTDEQAETVTRVLRNAQAIDLSSSATKMDPAETKAEIPKWMVSLIGIQTVVIIGAAVIALMVRH